MQMTPGLRIVDEGHVYELSDGSRITFMKRTNGQLVYEGTTNEEVLAVLIDRLRHLNNKLPCRENIIVLQKLQESRMWLNERTRKRVIQGVETTDIPHKEL